MGYMVMGGEGSLSKRALKGRGRVKISKFWGV